MQRKKMPSGWRRRKRARPGEILAAAAVILRERGAEDLRMADVAACAGITKGTVYLYFSSKKELLETLLLPPQHDLPLGRQRMSLGLSRLDGAPP